MTILADMNSIFTNVLLVVHVAVCILLCLVVLMQRPKQEGLGAAFGGGMTDQAFGARTTDVLQKGTVYLGTLLFIVTLALSVLVGAKSKSSGVDKALAADGESQLADNADDLSTMLEETPASPDAETPDTETPSVETPAPETPAAEPATPESVEESAATPDSVEESTTAPTSTSAPTPAPTTTPAEEATPEQP